MTSQKIIIGQGQSKLFRQPTKTLPPIHNSEVTMGVPASKFGLGLFGDSTRVKSGSNLGDCI